jgi:tetratricopeptide (TPR) repeat protein
VEIKEIKFECLLGISILTLSLILCVSICNADNLEPLDLLDSNVPDINEVNDINLMPMDFVDTAQANLVAKMDNSAGLQQQLKSLIGQINAIQFKSKEEKQLEEQAVADVNTVTENNEPQEKQETLKTINPNAKYQSESGVTDSNINKLDELISQPNDVGNPLELANILYKCGKLKEAAVFYQRAYNYKAGDNVMYKDKAWILFQTGNCLQKENPEEAVKVYKKLIIEYPESFWADAAKAKDHLVEWYIEQKPEKLLKKNK